MPNGELLTIGQIDVLLVLTRRVNGLETILEGIGRGDA